MIHQRNSNDITIIRQVCVNKEYGEGGIPRHTQLPLPSSKFDILYKFVNVKWLVEFYGISTLLDYLTPIPIYVI